MEQISGTLASSNPLQKVKSGTQAIANSAFVAVTGIDPQAIGLVEVEYIGASAKFTATFNPMAGLFGPIWFGARGLWSWALPVLVIEMLAIV